MTITRAPAARADRATPATASSPDRSQAAFLAALVASGLVSQESADRAGVLSRDMGVHVLTGLLRLNAIAEQALYRFHAQWLGWPLLEVGGAQLDELKLAVDALPKRLHLSTAWCERRGVLVYEREGGWWVAVREALTPQVVELLNRKAALHQTHFQPALITPTLYDTLRPRAVAPGELDTGASDLKTLRELAEEGPTIELVNTILSQAVTQRASDIHIEPGEFNFAVRLRVDGEMLQQSLQPRDRFDAVACRIKILSNLDIAERRMPQDGRINARVNGESFDIRVSVLPGSTGESIVLRLLRQERKPTQLQDLGMRPQQARMFEEWSRYPNGIILVTGPTGSGKSTTLYTALELANDRTKKIITIEDPVEYKIPGITQLQVNADIGFTFAGALRSILRHDPDVILVGEIRDEETARIAIQSSLTGHLVFSTLHTNSAIGAVTRLTDMGVEPFLISASVRGLMAQRLVRRLCPHCSAPLETPDAATMSLVEDWMRTQGGAPLNLRRPVGCDHCTGTGYYGRVAIYDLIPLDGTMTSLVARNAGEAELLHHLGREKDNGLMLSGMGHVVEGTSTVAELVRATG
jgi:general secretion pathway protein E